MTRQEFLSHLHTSLEIESIQALSEDTRLRDLEEFDSFSILSLIALADEHFGIKLTSDDFAAAQTPADLMRIIGDNRFS